MNEDMTIDFLEGAMRNYLDGEDIKDPAFRFSILMSQIGSLASHYNHDPDVNPSARSYKTRDGEISDFGHALLQLIVYGVSRNIPIENALVAANLALWDRDWKSKKCSNYTGIGVYPGEVFGITFVDPDAKFLDRAPSGIILITKHITCEQLTPHLHKVSGIITSEGGFTSHAAIIAREFKIPCVVGVGSFILELPSGCRVRFNSRDKDCNWINWIGNGESQ